MLAIATPDTAWAKNKKDKQTAEETTESAETDFGDPAVGRMYHERFLELYGAYDNNGLAEYVQRVGDGLTAHAEGDEYTWHFTVLDIETINAFATPGGYVYITRALLALLNTEAQLAAVLGHEIGHVAERHAARQHTAVNVIANVSDKLARFEEPNSFNLSDLFGAGLVRGYGREMELEADEASAKMISAAGYDPHATLQVVDLLKALGEYDRAGSETEPVDRYHTMLATHPDHERRRRELVDAASEDLAASFKPDNGEFLSHIDGIAWAGSRAQGVVRGTKFLHQEMNFALTFPDEWQILNLPDKIVGLSPDNEGMMQVSHFDRSERKHKKIIVEEFMQKVLGMTKWQSAKRTQINGLDAYIATVPGLRSPHGVRTGRAAAVYRGMDTFIFFGTTKDADRQRRFDRQFDRIIESIRLLDDSDRSLSEPVSVRVVRLEPGASLSDFTPIDGVDNPEALLRLLNGLYPDGEPEAGTRIKTLQ